MKKHTKQLLSTVLSAMLIIQGIPCNLYAEENSSEEIIMDVESDEFIISEEQENEIVESAYVFEEETESISESPESSEIFIEDISIIEDIPETITSNIPVVVIAEEEAFITVDDNGDASDGGNYGYTSYLSELEESNPALPLFSGTTTFNECYGNQLSTGAKDLYDGMAAGWAAGGSDMLYISLTTPITFEAQGTVSDGVFTWNGSSSDENYQVALTYMRTYIQSSFDSFVYDYPEVFWLNTVSFAPMNSSGSYLPDFTINEDGSVTGSISKMAVKGNEKWTNAKTSISSFQTMVSAAVSEVTSSFTDDMSNAEKLKVIHSYICDKAYYSETTYSHTAYGAFYNGAVVCEGYAKAYKVICDRLGYDCILVSGDANMTSKTEAHMWNYVKLDDQWYLVDTTWDDGATYPTTYLFAGSSTEGFYGTIAEERTLYNKFSSSSYTQSFYPPELATDYYHEWTFVSDTTTCTEDGEISYLCNLCNKGKVIDSEAPGHDLCMWYTIDEPSCKDTGTEKRTCFHCSYYETRELSVLTDHSYGEWFEVTPATCKEEGEQSRICSVCQETQTQAIPKLTSHSYSEWTETSPATCKEEGSETRICSVCQDTQTQAIPKLTTHSYSEWTETSPATCKEEGEQTRICSVCQDTQTQAIPKLTTHSYSEWTETSPATCKEEGKETRICSVCQDTQTQAIPKLTTHSYSEWTETSPATCKEEGELTRVCSVCQDAQTQVIPKLTTHSYGDWTISSPSTCKDTGVKIRSCKVCGNSETCSIDKLTTHTSSDWITTKKATCTETGTQITKCTVCGKQLSSKTVNATGHKYSDWITVSSTIRKKVCSSCGDTVTETVKATVNTKAFSKIKLSKTSYVYTGKAFKPKVTVYVGTTKLSSKYYSIKYSNNKNVGIATVTITGKDKYKTYKSSVTFKITPKKVTLSSVKSSKKGTAIIKWKKSTQNDGYQIQYSTSKNFKSGNSTKNISGSSKTSYSLTGLKSKKTYYVRARTYKKVNGSYWYGAWSSTKKIKIK